MSDAIERIRASWALAAADADRTTQLFYANLFRFDQTTKPLFQGDMGVQGRKLAETLTFIVDNLDAPEALIPAAEDLARRHVAYGVTPEQYTSVGGALMETFRQLLGPSFTAEDESAWVEVYTGLANHMVEVAYKA